MDRIFDLRYRIARIGSNDWLGWWESNALTGAGLYALERVFRRTTRLSAAHLAIRAARVRHDAAVPKEPLVHLFNFGEEFEGAFERWLIDRKGEGWEPSALIEEPAEAVKSSSAEALESLEFAIEGPKENRKPQNGYLVLDTISPADVQDEDRRLELAGSLAAAYGAASPRRLVIPYFRLAR